MPHLGPETHLFWGQKVKGQGYESQEHCRRGSWHCCECLLLLVVPANTELRTSREASDSAYLLSTGRRRRGGHLMRCKWSAPWRRSWIWRRRWRHATCASNLRRHPPARQAGLRGRPAGHDAPSSLLLLLQLRRRLRSRMWPTVRKLKIKLRRSAGHMWRGRRPSVLQLGPSVRPSVHLPVCPPPDGSRPLSCHCQRRRWAGVVRQNHTVVTVIIVVIIIIIINLL